MVCIPTFGFAHNRVRVTQPSVFHHKNIIRLSVMLAVGFLNGRGETKKKSPGIRVNALIFFFFSNRTLLTGSLKYENEPRECRKTRDSERSVKGTRATREKSGL